MTDLLKKKKLQILKRNLRTKFGEIDILAQDGKTLAVVEVKTNTSEQFGSVLRMIKPARQRKLVLLTCELQMKYQTESVRIDVVAVDKTGDSPKLKYYKGIIEHHG